MDHMSDERRVAGFIDKYTPAIAAQIKAAVEKQRPRRPATAKA